MRTLAWLLATKPHQAVSLPRAAHPLHNLCGCADWIRINVTSSSDKDMASFATEVMGSANSTFDSLTAFTDLISVKIKSAGPLIKCALDLDTDEVSRAVHEKLCHLTQLILVEQSVYFSNLDSANSQTFVCVIFGVTAIVFAVVSLYTRSKDSKAEAGIEAGAAPMRALNLRKEDAALLERVQQGVQQVNDRNSIANRKYIARQGKVRSACCCGSACSILTCMLYTGHALHVHC